MIQSYNLLDTQLWSDFYVMSGKLDMQSEKSRICSIRKFFLAYLANQQVYEKFQSLLRTFLQQITSLESLLLDTDYERSYLRVTFVTI